MEQIQSWTEVSGFQLTHKGERTWCGRMVDDPERGRGVVKYFQELAAGRRDAADPALARLEEKLGVALEGRWVVVWDSGAEPSVLDLDELRRIDTGRFTDEPWLDPSLWALQKARDKEAFGMAAAAERAQADAPAQPRAAPKPKAPKAPAPAAAAAKPAPAKRLPAPGKKKDLIVLGDDFFAQLYGDVPPVPSPPRPQLTIGKGKGPARPAAAAGAMPPPQPRAPAGKAGAKRKAAAASAPSGSGCRFPKLPEPRDVVVSVPPLQKKARAGAKADGGARPSLEPVSASLCTSDNASHDVASPRQQQQAAQQRRRQQQQQGEAKPRARKQEAPRAASKLTGGARATPAGGGGGAAGPTPGAAGGKTGQSAGQQGPGRQGASLADALKQHQQEYIHPRESGEQDGLGEGERQGASVADHGGIYAAPPPAQQVERDGWAKPVCLYDRVHGSDGRVYRVYSRHLIVPEDDAFKPSTKDRRLASWICKEFGDEDEFTVDCLVAERLDEEGESQFLIKYKEFELEPEEASWMERDGLGGAKQALRQWEKHGKAAAAQRLQMLLRDAGLV
eukprot:scaffold4.g4867.t1